MRWSCRFTTLSLPSAPAEHLLRAGPDNLARCGSWNETIPASSAWQSTFRTTRSLRSPLTRYFHTHGAMRRSSSKTWRTVRRRRKRAILRSSSAGIKPGAMGWSTSGLTHATSTNQTLPSFNKHWTPCFSGIAAPPNAMSISQTFQPAGRMPITTLTGNWLSGNAGSLPVDGPSRSLLP